MAEEIIVCSSSSETRVAVVDQGMLQEIFVERLNARGQVGNIYKGRVSRVLPGLQSAFIDIGEEKAAFTHISDLISAEGRSGSMSLDPQPSPAIGDLLYEGQTILVQVTKDPISTKGPRVTSHISLASRYVVFLPEGKSNGVSQRIDDERERERLISLLSDNLEAGSCIVRTVAEGVDESVLQNDIRFLEKRWLTISDDALASDAPALIYEELPVYLKTVRDLIDDSTQSIVVNDKFAYGLLRTFLMEFIPSKSGILKRADEKESVFEKYNIEEQINKAIAREVPLKSGGYIIFDQTEAMTTVDVNTGSFTGKKNLEETIYRTNLEAAEVIPRQLRLRGIGGIVILDFIDMVEDTHKKQVLRVLEKGQQNDRVAWRVSGFSEIGLVEMTRKRQRESLLRYLCDPCVFCRGRGYVKSVETMSHEVFREIRRKSVNFQQGDYMILASQSVVDHLLENEDEFLNQLADETGINIRLQVEVSYTQEEFDLVCINEDKAV